MASSNGGQTTMSSYYNITTTTTTNNNNNHNNDNDSSYELPDDASTFLLQRLKSMSDRLPRVDEDGLPYKFVPGESGIPRDGQLSQLQRDQLDIAQSEVQRLYGYTVTVQQRSQLVADQFNANHLAAGGVGFGGKISPKRVEVESNRRVQRIIGSRIHPTVQQQPQVHSCMLTEDIINNAGRKHLRRLCAERGVSMYVPPGESSTVCLRGKLRQLLPQQQQQQQVDCIYKKE